MQVKFHGMWKRKFIGNVEVTICIWMSCPECVECKGCMKGKVVGMASSGSGYFSQNVMLWRDLCNDQVPLDSMHSGCPYVASRMQSMAQMLWMCRICCGVAQSWQAVFWVAQ